MRILGYGFASFSFLQIQFNNVLFKAILDTVVVIATVYLQYIAMKRKNKSDGIK